MKKLLLISYWTNAHVSSLVLIKGIRSFQFFFLSFFVWLNFLFSSLLSSSESSESFRKSCGRQRRRRIRDGEKMRTSQFSNWVFNPFHSLRPPLDDFLLTVQVEKRKQRMTIRLFRKQSTPSISSWFKFYPVVLILPCPRHSSKSPEKLSPCPLIHCLSIPSQTFCISQNHLLTLDKFL